MNSATTIQIINFIRKIGIEIIYETIEHQTFLPGISIKNGAIVIDAEKLKYPGDLLHEAGHIAITPKDKRAELNNNVDTFAQQGGDEMAAIAWSYAACKHLGMDSNVVFHADGYKGDSASLIRNFDTGGYFGVPMLQWHGMAYETKKADELNAEAYPKMVNWLSQR